jgi:hypothetical protein
MAVIDATVLFSSQFNAHGLQTKSPTKPPMISECYVGILVSGIARVEPIMPPGAATAVTSNLCSALTTDA